MKKLGIYGLLFCLLVACVTGCGQTPATPTDVTNTAIEVTQSVILKAEPEEKPASVVQKITVVSENENRQQSVLFTK